MAPSLSAGREPKSTTHGSNSSINVPGLQRLHGESLAVTRNCALRPLTAPGGFRLPATRRWCHVRLWWLLSLQAATIETLARLSDAGWEGPFFLATKPLTSSCRRGRRTDPGFHLPRPTVEVRISAVAAKIAEARPPPIDPDFRAPVADLGALFRDSDPDHTWCRVEDTQIWQSLCRHSTTNMSPQGSPRSVRWEPFFVTTSPRGAMLSTSTA
jgi:hypothetical protein